MAIVDFTLHSDPVAIPDLISVLRRHRRIFIDTEIADWATPNPRLSLIQITTGDGRVHVIDVLAPGMKEAVDKFFIGEIMQDGTIQKWAHNASFERRFLGGESVKALECTLKLARSIPYHRLPLQSLSLANLVRHFFKNELDKSFQKADWGIRPIPEEQLKYAVWDPEWCRQIHEQVSSLVPIFEPAQESPIEIDTIYRELIIKLADTKRRLTALRNAVRDYMVTNSVRFFSDFSVHTRLSKMIQVRSLITMAQEKDPSRLLDFTMLLSNRLLSQLQAGAFEALQPKIAVSTVSVFLGPVAPHVKKSEHPTYELNPGDPIKVAVDYMRLDDQLRIYESNKKELRERMRPWLDFKSLKEWGAWKISDPRPRWHIDVRDLQPFVPIGQSCDVALPMRFQIAFQPEEIESHLGEITQKETPALIWRPGIYSGLTVTEARDWYESDQAQET